MRILYCVPRYWPSVGGAQLHTREFIHRLEKRHDIKVVTQFTSDRDTYLDTAVNVRPERYLDGSIEVYNLGPTGLWRPALKALRGAYGPLKVFNPIFSEALQHTMIAQMGKVAESFKPNIIHAVHVGLVYSSEAAYRAARDMKTPFVWTPLPHIESGGWKGRRFRRLYRNADALIALTERERQWLVQQGAPKDRIKVIPVGPIVHSSPNGENFRKTNNLNGFPVVLFLGQKLPYKGYKEIISAAPLVWSRMPDARFVFIGPRTSESEKFFQQVSDGRVLELPAVDLLEKTSALAACDVVCMPSSQESLGGVYLEAWSLRKPVIAANIQIAREVIDNGQDGLLTEQTPQAIANAINTILGDPLAAQKMGQAGFKKVQNTYNWDVLAGRMEDVYRSCIQD